MLRYIRISIHLMLLFICTGIRCSFPIFLFQYISCYCLSNTDAFKTLESSIFQYISCYCLSTLLLLTVGCSSYFNTSHVTVYLLKLRKKSLPELISIHLMLLFIGFNKEGILRLCKFQYISCYCLSRHWNKPCQKVQISIHLMLLFIIR